MCLRRGNPVAAILAWLVPSVYPSPPPPTPTFPPFSPPPHHRPCSGHPLVSVHSRGTRPSGRAPLKGPTYWCTPSCSRRGTSSRLRGRRRTRRSTGRCGMWWWTLRSPMWYARGGGGRPLFWLLPGRRVGRVLLRSPRGAARLALRERSAWWWSLGEGEVDGCGGLAASRTRRVNGAATVARLRVCAHTDGGPYCFPPFFFFFFVAYPLPLLWACGASSVH